MHHTNGSEWLSQYSHTSRIFCMIHVTWQLQKNGGKKRKKMLTENERIREEARDRNTPSGWGNGWGNGRGRWIVTEIQKGEGEWERVQKHREKEAHAGHPHNAHSDVVWFLLPCTTFHDSLFLSSVAAKSGPLEFRRIVGAAIEQIRSCLLITQVPLCKST